MFSKNGKISEKQLRRMVVLAVFASVIFVMPYLSAAMFGKSIVLGLLLFAGLSGLYVLYIFGMGEWYAKSEIATGKNGLMDVFAESGLIGKTLGVIQLLRLVVRLAFYILLAIAILREAQVPFMQRDSGTVWSDILVALPLLLVGIYGANTQVEKQGRIHEMLFWSLFLPFIAMLLFGLGEVDCHVFLPKADMPFGSMLLSSYALLVFVIPMEHYLYLRPSLCCEGKRNRTGVAVIAAVAAAAVITILIIGIYGLNGAAEEPMTTIAIMRYIRLPFGILERFDVLMIWFFMIGCFVLICQTLYFAGYIFKRICKKKNMLWVLCIVLFLALMIVFGVRTYENGLLTFICYGAVIDVPLSLVMPLLGIGVNWFYEE